MLYLVAPFETTQVTNGDKNATNFITIHNLREYYTKRLCQNININQMLE